MTDAAASYADNSIDASFGCTVEIVSAFVKHNAVPAAEMPSLIRTVHATLLGLPSAGAVEPRIEPKLAVPVRKSLSADFIVCLEDGKKLKMLKRYLRSRYRLSPEEYRQKWGCHRTIRWWRRTTLPSVLPLQSRSASVVVGR